MFPALALCSDKGLTLKMSAWKLHDKLNYAHILNGFYLIWAIVGQMHTI